MTPHTIPTAPTATTVTKQPRVGLDAATLVEGIRDRKGRDIALVDLSGIDTAATSMFIIATGTSTTQVESIADSVEEHTRLATGVKPYATDGYGPSEWIVMDYGWAMVHVFLPEARQRYNLEELWADAPITRLPDLD